MHIACERFPLRLSAARRPSVSPAPYAVAPFPQRPQLPDAAAGRHSVVDYLQGLYEPAAQPRELDAASAAAAGLVAGAKVTFTRPHPNSAGGLPGGPRGGSALQHRHAGAETEARDPSVDGSGASGGRKPEADWPAHTKTRASAGDFEALYVALAAWRRAHGTCHVPRNCFDAPPLLGDWVRHLRRAARHGTLPRWQRDRLDLLGFEWRVDRATAAWLQMYHQLRRYKAVHGALDLLCTSPSSSDSQGGVHARQGSPWAARLAAWLQAQSMALAAGLLTTAQERTLRKLGVRLVLDPGQLQAQVSLQGLNAHERKLQRRRLRARVAIRQGSSKGTHPLKLKQRSWQAHGAVST